MDLKTLLGDSFKENMTLADIEAALKDKNLVDPSTLPESVSKKLFDDTAHDLAEAKKKLKEKSTADEQAAQAQKDIQDQLAALQKENSLFKNKGQLLSSGYDAKTAAAMAEALVGGDMAKFTELNTKFLESTKTALQASIKADLLKETPGLQGGGAGGGQGGDNGPSLGEKMAQSYNAQYAPAPSTSAGAQQGK